MAKEKRVSLKKAVDKFWPRTKKELEKASENAKVLLAKGEKYLRGVSEKGVRHTKKISLSLKREKLYYNLGKTIAATASGNWKDNKKISDYLNAVKKLDRQIKSIRV
ncbi:MAG: hypothetical protein NG737_07860 [Omnitrophica bacterium]|nr:hypothetical protein [Candidatus Omnitrophota bacterium]